MSPFDFNAALAARIDSYLDLAVALSAGVDHLLDEFVALQETLVLLVPDSEFNAVFSETGLTDLRVLLASVAGRIEVVIDSPGLQMTPQETRELRARATSRRGGPPAAPPTRGEPPQARIGALKERVADVRESAQRGGHAPGSANDLRGDPR